MRWWALAAGLCLASVTSAAQAQLVDSVAASSFEYYPSAHNGDLPGETQLNVARVSAGLPIPLTASTTLLGGVAYELIDVRPSMAKAFQLHAPKASFGVLHDFSKHWGMVAVPEAGLASDFSDAVNVAVPGDSSTDRASLSDEQLLQPLLEQLCSEDWRRGEDSLTALLSTNALTTRVGRALATLGLVQVQVLAHVDLRGALAVLVPILDEAGRGELPDEIAGRAHVMATFVSAAPDSRFHDLGRVNAHAARAEALLPADADDLRVMSATACISASRYLGPEVTLHAYKTHLPYLERGRSALSRLLADALAGLVATVRNDAAASAELGGRALAAAENMGPCASAKKTCPRWLGSSSRAWPRLVRPLRGLAPAPCGPYKTTAGPATSGSCATWSSAPWPTPQCRASCGPSTRASQEPEQLRRHADPSRATTHSMAG